MARRYRVLLLASHPVQYAAPIYRLMARHPQLDIQVAYCSLQGAERGTDPEFGVEVAWDIPLLDGYPWVQVPNVSPRPRLGSFFGMINPGLWKIVRHGGFDAVVAYTGYAYASFWIAAAAAKASGARLLIATDASSLLTPDKKRWKPWVKRFLLPKIYRLPDVVIVPSSEGMWLLRSLGIGEDRIALNPYAVNNDWWTRQAARVDRDAVRARWGVPATAPVLLYCAKLQPWKRPQDALRAFAKLSVPDAHLVFAGEGPLRGELEREAKSSGAAERVRFLGFVNQSQLPAIYRAADLLILPSEYDAFGVVANEAMLCGCPVIVSDRVGARRDLVIPGETGFTYPCGDLDTLSLILQEILPYRPRLRQLGEAARKRMETWSPRENIAGLVEAIETALQVKTTESDHQP